jgi:DNA polymerase
VKGIFDTRGLIHNLWGGAMTENVTQRMARDVMAEAILRVEAAGFPVIFSVHDEVVLEVDEGSDKFLADAKAEAERLLTITPDWAEGLPLAVEGDYNDRYCK